MVKKTIQKLVSKAAFARLGGVSSAAITKAIANGLAAVTVGKRIDANHPDAVAYLVNRAKSRAPDPDTGPATGIDPLYEDAIRHCQTVGKISIRELQHTFPIGFERAKRIANTMKVNGVAINGETVPPPPPDAKPPPLRGVAAKNANAKKAPPPPPIDPDEMLLEIPEDIRLFADMSLRELVSRFGTDSRFVDWLRATKSIEDINEKRIKNAASEGTLVSRDLVKLGIIDPIEQAHMKLLTDGAKTITRRATAMHDAGRSLDEVEKFVKDQISSFIRPVKAKVARTMKGLEGG